MPSILLPAPDRLRKPPLGARINRAHPLAVGLADDWLYSEGGGTRLVNLASPANPATLTNTAAYPRNWEATPAGPGIYVAIYDGINPTVYAESAGTNQTRMTYDCLVVVDTTTSVGVMGQFENTILDSTYDRQLSINSSGQFVSYIYDGSPKAATGTTVVASKQAYRVTVTADGTNLRLFVNGVLEATTAAGSPYAAYTNPRFFVGGARESGLLSPTATAGWIVRARVWHRALSGEEVRAVHADPYQMYAPPVWRRYVAAPAGGGGPTAPAARRTLLGAGF